MDAHDQRRRVGEPMPALDLHAEVERPGVDASLDETGETARRVVAAGGRAALGLTLGSRSARALPALTGARRRCRRAPARRCLAARRRAAAARTPPSPGAIACAVSTRSVARRLHSPSLSCRHAHSPFPSELSTVLPRRRPMHAARGPRSLPADGELGHRRARAVGRRRARRLRGGRGLRLAAGAGAPRRAPAGDPRHERRGVNAAYLASCAHLDAETAVEGLLARWREMRTGL
jgi:hypothetical protein